MNKFDTGILSGSRFLTHVDFTSLVAKASQLFESLGVAEGDSVGLLMRNDIAFLVAQAGATSAGAYPVPLNWHANPDDIVYVLADAEAKALVVHADIAGGLRDRLSIGCAMIVVPTPLEVCTAFKISADKAQVSPGDLNWDIAIQQQQAVLPDNQSGERGGMYYTSGTTGKPKGVMRMPVDAAGALRMSRIVDEIFGVERGQPVRVLVSAPVYHAAPNFFANRGAESGSLVVIQPRFDAEELLKSVQEHRITHIYLVPTMMIKLLSLPAEIRVRYDLSSLMRVSHSAAPCPWSIKKQMIDWLGPIVYEFYGGTENGCVTQLSSEEALRKPGSVGRLMHNARLKVYDDAGNPLGPGQTGEIYAKNFNLPDFTYKNLHGKRTEVERDELISLGDVGYVDDEGYLFLCDRKRDMIISGGVNIYPAQIEAVLQLMPGVADCAVFGVPDPVFGEAVCTHIQPESMVPLTEVDVATWLKGKLASYEQPKIIKIDSSLPREESGKIMKRKVRDTYWSDVGRAI